jgi:hypothetical protein
MTPWTGRLKTLEAMIDVSMRNQNVAVFSVTISGLHQRYRPRQDAYFEVCRISVSTKSGRCWKRLCHEYSERYRRQ